jgi:hypothetical protein
MNVTPDTPPPAASCLPPPSLPALLPPLPQLVFTFPEDAKTSTGALFWSPPKRWMLGPGFAPSAWLLACLLGPLHATECGRRHMLSNMSALPLWATRLFSLTAHPLPNPSPSLLQLPAAAGVRCGRCLPRRIRAGSRHPQGPGERSGQQCTNCTARAKGGSGQQASAAAVAASPVLLLLRSPPVHVCALCIDLSVVRLHHQPLPSHHPPTHHPPTPPLILPSPLSRSTA